MCAAADKRRQRQLCTTPIWVFPHTPEALVTPAMRKALKQPLTYTDTHTHTSTLKWSWVQEQCVSSTGPKLSRLSIILNLTMLAMFILQEHISPSLQHQTHNAVLYPFKAHTQVYLKYKHYPTHQPLLCTKYQMCCFVVYLFAKVSRKKQMVLGHIGTLLKKNLDQRTPSYALRKWSFNSPAIKRGIVP